jgi:trans-aconitate methyltransferase
MSSALYSSPWLYRLAMKCLYGSNHKARLSAVAALIPAGSTVLDVCCGPGDLSQLVIEKGSSYFGVDKSESFLTNCKKRGIEVKSCDVAGGALPSGLWDYVVLQASLYQFIPNHVEVIQNLLKRARKAVILSEPIRNLAQSKNWLVSEAAKYLTSTGTGRVEHRFTLEGLTDVMGKLESQGHSVKSIKVCGGRDHIFVISVLSPA